MTDERFIPASKYIGPYAEPMRRLIEINNELFQLREGLLEYRRPGVRPFFEARPEDAAAVETCGTLWAIGELVGEMYVAIASGNIDDEVDPGDKLWG